MIRPARWLPLSLAVHAAALGGGLWLAREPGERALFVDMTRLESGTDSARAGSARGGGAAARVPAASGARGGAGGAGALALAIPGAGGAGAYGPYLAALRRRLQEALEYPAAARRRGLSGTVHLEIALEATGRVSEVMLVRSSSHALLDDAALDAARGLRRVPFPPDVRPRALRARLPVVFELR